MALMFSANQFENSFTAHTLGNWEVPKYFPERPKQRTGSTKVIANERGHLLPNVKRPNSSPWGNYKNTWQLPDRISRHQIEAINGPLIGKNKWIKLKYDKAELDKKACLEADNGKTPPPKSESPKTVIKKKKYKQQQTQSLDLEYIPGDLTKPNDQHESRSLLLQQKYDRDQGKSPTHHPPPNDLYLEKHQCTNQVEILNAEADKRRNPSPHILGEDVEDNFEKMRLSVKEIPDKPNARSPSPVVPAYYNFQLARKMHQENLDHQPLPDVVSDNVYRRLQTQGFEYPGLGLDVAPVATGVGLKAYNAGPTHCTKSKIFRPKTCVGTKKNPSANNNQQRTSGIFRPQSVIDKKMGQMDLAICWDFRPANPDDEPKRSVHIDGTNESAGPAIFTVVRTPRTPDNLDTGRSAGVFTNTFGELNFFDKDIIRKKKSFAAAGGGGGGGNSGGRQAGNLKCSCGTSPVNFDNTAGSDRCRSKSSSRNGSGILENDDKLYKSSPNLSRIVVSEFKENRNTSNNSNHYGKQYLLEKFHRPDKPHTCSKYGPTSKQINSNGAQINQHKQPGFFKRTIRMCHKVAPQPYPEEREKEFFKPAFKAGVPKGNIGSFDSGCSTMSSMFSTYPQKVLVVPRPRNPYSKKNYNIDTLVPPFTSFKGGAGQGGYPEYWRLASVYQHAYKPIEQRRRPLLETVYK